MQQDELVIKSISLGELRLKSKVFSEAKGVVTDNCSGSVDNRLLWLMFSLARR